MNKWAPAQLLTALFLIGIPRIGYADDQLDEATSAFKEGVELFDKGEYKKASEAFRKANRLNSNWKILYNIGQSEASSKRYGLALEAFEAYLAQAGDDIDLARRDEVLAEVQRLKLMVGSLDIAAPDDSLVYVDGEIRGTTPLAGPILVSSGITHTVEIKQGDTLLHTQPIKLSSGQTRAVTVESPEPNTSAGDTAATGKSSDNTNNSTGATDSATVNTADAPSRIPAITLIAVGGAALIAGAVTGSIALKRGNTLESDYPDGVPPEKEDDMKSVDNLALTTDILLGVGIVSAAVGTILLIRNKKHAEESPITAAPVFGPQLTGFVIERRF
ncbi:MAG: tetratricopeptide repeat protein [Deltaproteobacteria bacterium]|nr:tetratricopeptide repeat protein [Deltaproteobacteria bacterium]MBN2671621.1 tetratricopeptide repeat protein [Deltaproteobacteria bacterium]